MSVFPAFDTAQLSRSAVDLNLESRKPSQSQHRTETCPITHLSPRILTEAGVSMGVPGHPWVLLPVQAGVIIRVRIICTTSPGVTAAAARQSTLRTVQQQLMCEGGV